MKNLFHSIWIASRMTLLFAVVCGLVYTMAVTGVGQIIFPSQSNGSLITHNGKVVGSALIGQYFTEPKYFQGRPCPSDSLPTATAPRGACIQPYPYDQTHGATNICMNVAANPSCESTGSNLGPSNAILIAQIRARAALIRKQNPTYHGPIPIDLVTADFTGFDPDISEASALLQVDAVANARHVSPHLIRQLVENNVQGRILGIFGEPYVNVLMLNIALDDGYPT